MPSKYMIYAKMDEETYNYLYPYLFETSEIPSRQTADNDYIAFIGYTKSKKDLKRYLSERSQSSVKYIVKKHDDDDEYCNPSYKIVSTNIQTSVGNTSVFMMLSGKEINCIEFATEDTINHIQDIITVDYILFKERYVDALDYLSYTAMYDMYCVRGDDVDCRCEHAHYQSSYNMTPGGNPLNLPEDNTFYCLIMNYLRPLFL